MLIGFSVQNFKSFKEPQKISFLASESVLHKDHLLPVKNRRILRSAVIFGANASGKTNLIQAIDFSSRIILHGLTEVNLINAHFRIEDGYYNKPGVFEYRIILNETEYSYGIVISYAEKCILSEWLLRMNNGKEEYIFNRNLIEGHSRVETDIYKENFANDAVFDYKRLRIYLEDFGKNISKQLKQKTILSDLAVRSNRDNGLFKEIVDIYNFFNEILVIFPHTRYGGLDTIVADEERNMRFSELFNKFDTGIESIERKRQSFEFENQFADAPKEVIEEMKVNISNNIDTDIPLLVNYNDKMILLRKDEKGNIVYDKMLLNHGNEKELFEFEDESDGTKRLFDIAPLLLFNKKKTIFIDEIDRSMHTLLIRKFFEAFFFRMAKTGSYSQLVATTHDATCLDLDLFRQDEIWLVDRKVDHSSSVYSLNKFKEVAGKNISKEYLLGRYGAVPVFRDVLATLEDTSDE